MVRKRKPDEVLLVELLQIGGIKLQRKRLKRFSPEYKAYLKSPEWEAKRQEVFRRDNYQCCFCGSSKDLECHHKRYTNLGNEPLEDLSTFCVRCHERGHGRTARRRKKSK